MGLSLTANWVAIVILAIRTWYVSSGYLAYGWALGQGKFVFGPVDFGIVELQPIGPQDEIIISNIHDIELGTFFVGSS